MQIKLYNYDIITYYLPNLENPNNFLKILNKFPLYINRFSERNKVYDKKRAFAKSMVIREK
jgi:hypothetical protein